MNLVRNWMSGMASEGRVHGQGTALPGFTSELAFRPALYIHNNGRTKADYGLPCSCLKLGLSGQAWTWKVSLLSRAAT